MRRCFSRSDRKSGVTLPELLLSSALIGFVLISIYALLTAGVRYYKNSLTWIELQQDSLLSLVQLTKELGESNRQTVRIYPDPAGLVFASPRASDGVYEIDPSGLPLWQKFVCYYVTDVNGVPSLIRKELTLVAAGYAGPQVVPPVTFNSTAWFRDAKLPRKVVARNIDRLTVTGASPVAIELGVAKEEMGKSFEVEVQVKVFLRN